MDLSFDTTLHSRKNKKIRPLSEQGCSLGNCCKLGGLIEELLYLKLIGQCYNMLFGCKSQNFLGNLLFSYMDLLVQYRLSAF